MSPDEIQAQLSELFCPPLDTTLVAAIAYEPGQTLQSAKEVCETLAAAALPDTQDDVRPASPPPSSHKTQEDAKPARSKGGASARRKAFGGKLTNGDGTSSNDTTTTTTSSSSKAATSKTTSTDTSTTASTSSSALSSPQNTAADAATVERLLNEWSLFDKSFQDPDNLHLTDEDTSDNEASTAPTSEPGHELLSTSPRTANKLVEAEAHQAERLGELSGSYRIDPSSIASGSADLNEEGRNGLKYRDSFDPVLFLQHAFPSRTVEFLRETLNDSHGDVQTTVDTIMTIDLTEAEDARSATAAQAHTAQVRKGGGLDYEALAHGTSTGGMEDPHLKGKKRRAARKRLQQEQRLVSSGLPTTNAAGTKEKNKFKVNLTDVRHGGPSSNTFLKKLADTPSSQCSRTTTPLPQLTDEELAAKLAAEEEAASRDPDADQPVSDNQWLLTSSVLAQLSTLLDIEASKVTSTYNSSSFNLAVCFARLLEGEADRYPTLSSLDEAGEAPSGTAENIASGIAAIGGVTQSAASKALRATKGRQDAALDLLQLQGLVQQQVGEADALDPMGRLRELGAAEVPKTVEAANAKGFAIDARAGEGKFVRTFPTPSQAALAKTNPSGNGSVYSNVVGRKAPGPTSGAAAALQSGSAVASVFPASSAFVNAASADSDLLNDPVAVERGLASHTAHYDPMRRMTEYRFVAEEYRMRRDEALRKAASAWKSQRGGVRTGGKGGDGGRGGIAWHYADEARRLDAKSRAWSLRASQALVEDRRRAAIGVVRPGTQPTASHTWASNTIDLHGVTVHEALSIVREQVTRWYARPGPGMNPPPFKIVTGVGRHSPHQIAVLRPAIAKMLDREGWRYDVDHLRGVITVRGTK